MGSGFSGAAGAKPPDRVEDREPLDNLILVGHDHLAHVLKRIEKHHNKRNLPRRSSASQGAANEAGPHQGLENAIPLGYDYPDRPAPPDKIRCESSLGGLPALSGVEGLNHYYVDEAA